jgi:excisionase family DNA binding protein
MKIDRAPATREPRSEPVIERLMTADEVAAALAVNRKFVYARHHAGELRGYKLGSSYRFRPEDVRAFLDASLAPPDEPPRARERARKPAPAGSFRALLDRGTA